MGWGPKTPKPDPLIGKAAVMAAETGAKAQDWAMQMFETQILPRQKEMDKLVTDVTNQQLSDMRANSEFTAGQRQLYKDVYEPMERQSAAEIAAYGGEEMVDKRMGMASANVNQAFSNARSQSVQEMAKYGISLNPNAMAAQMRRLTTAQGSADAGARNQAAFDTQDRGIALRAQTASIARGVPVAASNMATQSSGIGSGAVGAAGAGVGAGVSGMSVGQQGFNTAIQGANTAGSLMNNQFGTQMEGYGIKSKLMGDMFGEAMGVAGYFIGSSKKFKDRNESLDGDDVLGKIRGMKVDRWGYKGEGELHVGPYAEELHQKFGVGNGTFIGPTDVGGVALAGVKQLDAKLDKIAQRMGLNLEAA